MGALAAQPLAALVDTAWIGHIGTTELAGVGVALSVYGTVTKLINIPILAVTTSTVASAVGSGDSKAVSGALTTAVSVGLAAGALQAALLVGVGGPVLNLWGAPTGSGVQHAALQFLQVRALGTPATVSLLVLQGMFRGLGNTQVVLVATLASTAINMVMTPLLAFTCNWGVGGAAAATVLAEVAAGAGLLSLALRQYGWQGQGQQRPGPARLLEFLRPCGYLVVRTLAVGGTMALASSLATRIDPSHAAAHQVCLQVWLASSLLADSLAVAAQSLLAKYAAAGDVASATRVVARTVSISLALGVALAGSLALLRGGVAGAFTRDAAVAACIAGIMPAVVLTQPLNALAFVLDGVLYGVSGFEYAARATVVAAAPAVGVMLLGTRWAAGAPDAQLAWVWAGLTVLMAMRALTIYVPYRMRHDPFDKLA